MSLFTHKSVSCPIKSPNLHFYVDPVMLYCSHVFCRSCCLTLAKTSNDQSSIYITGEPEIIKSSVFCQYLWQFSFY